MTDRVRILLHEANDIDALLREYIVESMETNGRHEASIRESRHTNLARIEELLNRLGEVYETALARDGRYVGAEA